MNEILNKYKDKQSRNSADSNTRKLASVSNSRIIAAKTVLDQINFLCSEGNSKWLMN
jgi:hypothetical protein